MLWSPPDSSPATHEVVARRGVMVPGEVRPYTVRFWRGTANRFEVGHRIGIEISSSWYPYYYPNFNTGADNLATIASDEAVVARQTIHHGAPYPSHIVLPVVSEPTAI